MSYDGDGDEMNDGERGPCRDCPQRRQYGRGDEVNGGRGRGHGCLPRQLCQSDDADDEARAIAVDEHGHCPHRRRCCLGDGDGGAAAVRGGHECGHCLSAPYRGDSDDDVVGGMSDLHERDRYPLLPLQGHSCGGSPDHGHGRCRLHLRQRYDRGEDRRVSHWDRQTQTSDPAD